MSTNHPGRRTSARKPHKSTLLDAREYAGHTQQQAAEAVYRTRRGWQDMERGERPVDPAILELYLIKTGQIEPGETWSSRSA